MNRLTKKLQAEYDKRNLDTEKEVNTIQAKDGNKAVGGRSHPSEISKGEKGELNA
jgi:hypothetical protein